MATNASSAWDVPGTEANTTACGLPGGILAKSSGRSWGATYVHGPRSEAALNHRPESNKYASPLVVWKKSWLSESAAYCNAVPRTGLKSGRLSVRSNSAGLVLTMLIVWFGESPLILRDHVYLTVHYREAPGVAEGTPVRKSG